MTSASAELRAAEEPLFPSFLPCGVVRNEEGKSAAFALLPMLVGLPELHRLVKTNRNGSPLTAGDANADPDSTPLARRTIISEARLLVPSASAASAP